MIRNHQLSHAPDTNHAYLGLETSPSWKEDPPHENQQEKIQSILCYHDIVYEHK